MENGRIQSAKTWLEMFAEDRYCQVSDTLRDAKEFIDIAEKENSESKDLKEMKEIYTALSNVRDQLKKYSREDNKTK